MERKAFSLLHSMEDSWWYKGRAHVAKRVLSRIQGKQKRALDLGAGFGGMSSVLHTCAEMVEGVEPDSESREHAASRGYAHMYENLDDTLPPYNLVAMFDVLEHVEDDKSLLIKLNGMIESKGYVALTVPAFQWLWSEHDVAHHHFRRYTTSSVRAVLEHAGFEVVYASYWNMLLFIPAAIVRLIFGRSGSSSIGMSKILDTIFLAVIYAESLLIPFMPLPFGTGIVMLARKK